MELGAVQDPTTFLVTPSGVALPNPRVFSELSPRLDYAISANNTLTVRYQYERNNQQNNGISQFSLPTQGYNSIQSEQTVQISDDQVFSTKIVNEIRFQYLHENTTQTPGEFAASCDCACLRYRGRQRCRNQLESREPL